MISMTLLSIVQNFLAVESRFSHTLQPQEYAELFDPNPNLTSLISTRYTSSSSPVLSVYLAPSASHFTPSLARSDFKSSTSAAIPSVLSLSFIVSSLSSYKSRPMDVTLSRTRPLKKSLATTARPLCRADKCSLKHCNSVLNRERSSINRRKRSEVHSRAKTCPSAGKLSKKLTRR